MQRPRDSRSIAPPTRRAARPRGAAGPRTLLLAGGLLLLVAGGAVLASGILDPAGGDAGARDAAAVAGPRGADGTDAAAPARVPEGDAAAEPGPREAAASPETPRREGAAESSGGGPAEAPADSVGGRDPAGAGQAAPAPGQAPPRQDRAAAAPGLAAAPDVERLLALAEEAYSSLRSLRASFRQEIEVPLLERHREGHGEWLQKGRGRFKMDFTEPPQDVIVADGEHLWLYYPSTNPRQVIRSDLEAPQTRAGTADVLARILAEARTNYTATYAGTEPVAGVRTHVVRLRPAERSPYREVTVWIGAEDHLVRQFRIVEQNETVRTVTLTDLRPNAPIADSVFRFTPPPDADVFSG